MTGATADDQPQAEPLVERVEKPDGRYVLYFSWPEDPSSAARERHRDDEGGVGE